jgi:superfamily II DNA/RNA helicase
MENSRTRETAVDETAAQAPTFADFGLDPGIAKVIAGMGFEAPTPVQARIFQDAMAGKNLIVMAQTRIGRIKGLSRPELT